ncbi:MAG: CoB--CoM heterodisulfide reductase iron-sulfur subunit A family protein [Elusimicrobia bacterium]|nr:CoB--CoM heterodisulfide reductase iron-sulfur subunit A family protein [Elusimicrobiota bacterium]
MSADILVVGGGIAGMTAALEAAEAGKTVVLSEAKPSLGGRVAATNQYFPKLCPPSCGIEINLRRIKANPSITVLTLAEVEGLSGGRGGHEARIKLHPRFVNEKCTACGDCEKACEVERDNDFNFGLDKTKAVYLPHLMAYPFRYVVDPKHAGDPRMKKAAAACAYGAVELDMKPRTLTLKVGAVVWATGWKPYDAAKLDRLGFGRYRNVVTNSMMERLASQSGPTGGKLVRPSDQVGLKKVGFVQCAGSRDEKHLPYCSAVCCLASMKQATYVRAQYPDAEIHIFYIDVRAPGRMEDFYVKAQEDKKLFFHRGKVGTITEVEGSRNLVLEAENTLTGELTKTEVDMAVLAVGMVPNTADEKPPLDTPLDEFGFIAPDTGKGVIGAGTVTRPLDVASSVVDATGAAMRALIAAAEASAAGRN